MGNTFDRPPTTTPLRKIKKKSHHKLHQSHQSHPHQSHQSHSHQSHSHQSHPHQSHPHQSHTSLSCIKKIMMYTSHPPHTIRFDEPRLNKKNCIFDVTKVLVRINSLTDPLEWDYLFVYRAIPSTQYDENNNDNDNDNRSWAWTCAGGEKATADLVRQTFITPKQVATYLCQALEERKEMARLEVDINFKERQKGCDYVYWHSDTDDFIVDQTKMGHSNPSIIHFDARSSYLGDVFECSTVELKYIFDFHQNKQISIWDKEELMFQEKARSRKERGKNVDQSNKYMK